MALQLLGPFDMN